MDYKEYHETKIKIEEYENLQRQLNEMSRARDAARRYPDINLFARGDVDIRPYEVPDGVKAQLTQAMSDKLESMITEIKEAMYKV